MRLEKTSFEIGQTKKIDDETVVLFVKVGESAPIEKILPKSKEIFDFSLHVI